MPADCPDWVLRLRPAGLAAPFVSQRYKGPRVATQASDRFDRAQVLESIRDKLSLATSWGLRLAGRPNVKGWAPCHAIGREDVHPSAAIHKESGSYVDHGSGMKLSLFDLGAELGVYCDWRDAVQQLGARNV